MEKKTLSYGLMKRERSMLALTKYLPVRAIA